MNKMTSSPVIFHFSITYNNYNLNRSLGNFSSPISLKSCLCYAYTDNTAIGLLYTGWYAQMIRTAGPEFHLTTNHSQSPSPISCIPESLVNVLNTFHKATHVPPLYNVPNDSCVFWAVLVLTIPWLEILFCNCWEKGTILQLTLVSDPAMTSTSILYCILCSHLNLCIPFPDPEYPIRMLS